MNTFFLCTNPLCLNPENVESYIYHAVSPRFFAYIRKVDTTASNSLVAAKGRNKGFLYRPSNGTFNLYFIIIDRCFDKVKDETLNDALKQAIKFYCTTLEQGRKDKGGYLLFRDYNRLTRDVQIIYLPKPNIHLLSFNEGIMNFDDEEDVFRFLIESMNYNEVALERGDKNIAVPEL
jgi:hypothetical protein